MAKIRSLIKWAEEGEKSTRYFFNLEKKRGQEKLWYRIKSSDDNYKYDIDSIMNEQVEFYSKFNQMGGMKIVLTNLQGILLISWTITKKKRMSKTSA